MGTKSKPLGLREEVLLAALQQSGTDCQRIFTMEDLVVRAWLNNKRSWGLRGYEDQYPDSDKLEKEMGSRGGDQKGIVDLGLLERVGPRVYRITPAGVAAAAALNPSDSASQEKADRELEAALKGIVEHPVFRDWLVDRTRPRYFREAGHFWGIAPGTPARTVCDRIAAVDRTLEAALALLDARGVDEIAAARGKVLFDRRDINRCMELQATLKQRFARDLKILAPEINLDPYTSHTATGRKGSDAGGPSSH